MLINTQKDISRDLTAGGSASIPHSFGDILHKDPESMDESNPASVKLKLIKCHAPLVWIPE